MLFLVKCRDVFRLGRHLLRELPARELAKRLVRVLRQEGMPGVRQRVRTHLQRLLGHSSTRSGAVSMAAAIIRSPAGQYELTSPPARYTYVEPRSPADLEAQLAAWPEPPRFSIVVPVYNTRQDWLDEVVGSVQAQWYPHWELILVDDLSPDPVTQAALRALDDPRIRVIHLPDNRGIAGATNAGLAEATGTFIVFMDHDDVLTPDCLYELARCIEREQPDFVYSDEDKLAQDGSYVEPHFKPDWSPDTMMSTMFTCHVSCVRRSLLAQVGGLNPEFDGCQDWDFVLRVSEATRRISHVPKVLYHWRITPASTAADIAAKPYILDASRRVRAAALARRGLSGTVEPVSQVPGYFRVNYAVQGAPLVSVIIPSRDNVAMLRRCVESIRARSSYPNVEVLILDNGSVDPETLAYLAGLTQHPRTTVVRHDAPFNYSELNNLGVRHARGELLLFLNDDTEVLQADWLERLAGYAQLPHVGAVGAKLLYADGRQIQHAGILNLASGPVHAFLHQDTDAPGYFMRALLEYNWLAVTGACLMIARDKFERVGGFAECLPVAYNDVDLGFRLHAAGYYNVVVPAVQLIHHESVSRGQDHADPAKQARLQRDMALLYARNPRYFQHDPFHNINLHPLGLYFEVPV